MKTVNIRDFIMVLFGMILSLSILFYPSIGARILLIFIVWFLVLLIAIIKDEINPKEL